jgi:hypothetical protein
MIVSCDSVVFFPPGWFMYYLFFSLTLSPVFIYFLLKIYSFLDLCVCDCLSSSLVCSIPLGVFCNAGLVDINCFSFCLSWKVFTPPLNLNDNFAGYSNLGWQLFSYRDWNILSHVLLDFRVYSERSELIFMCLPLYVSWHFIPCSFQYLFFFFLLSSLEILIIILYEEVLFWSCLFGILNASSKWMSISFPRFGVIVAIISLNRFLCL